MNDHLLQTNLKYIKVPYRNIPPFEPKLKTGSFSSETESSRNDSCLLWSFPALTHKWLLMWDFWQHDEELHWHIGLKRAKLLLWTWQEGKNNLRSYFFFFKHKWCGSSWKKQKVLLNSGRSIVTGCSCTTFCFIYRLAPRSPIRVPTKAPIQQDRITVGH